MKIPWRVWIALITLLLFAPGCKWGENKQAVLKNPDFPKIVSFELFQKQAAQLKPGVVALVEKPLWELPPNGVIKTPFYDEVAQGKYYMPVAPGDENPKDPRINPAKADVILAEYSLSVALAAAFPGPVWKIEAMAMGKNGRNHFMLRRAGPVGSQLQPPGLKARENRRYAKTIRVRGPEGTALVEKYEVTVSRYAAFLNEAKPPYDEVSKWFSIKDPASPIVFYKGEYRAYKGLDRLPVYNVSWYGANAFCEHFGMGLPTLSEWQAAAGETENRSFPWGNQTDFPNRANFAGEPDGYPYLAPVDAFPSGRGPRGHFNLAGNVYEWVDGQALVGSSWVHDPGQARMGFVETNIPSARNLHDGFRCAKRK